MRRLELHTENLNKSTHQVRLTMKKVWQRRFHVFPLHYTPVRIILMAVLITHRCSVLERSFCFD